MEANVSDLHAAASNAACEANPSSFKVAIFFANRLYHLSSSGALQKYTQCACRVCGVSDLSHE